MPANYYPPVAFHFSVSIKKGDQSIDSSWQEVSGLSAEVVTEDLVEGGQNLFVYKLAVGTRYPALVLKRGAPINRGSPLIAWINDAVVNFKFDLCSILVTLLNENHQPLMTWNFDKAYPVKWNFSDLKSTDSAVVIESIEFVHQGDHLFGTH
jgi:phage tail-like protein